jgi:hypothetical protein
MWSAAIGILLILGGLAVALGPICYGFHREVLARHVRAVREELAAITGRPLRCAHCGELVEEASSVSVLGSANFEPDVLSEAS